MKIFLLFPLLFSVQLFGQEQITITDKTTLQPIDGATISLKGSEVILCKTDALGIAILPEQTTKSMLVISANGYEPFEIAYVYAVNNTFELIKSFNSIDDVVVVASRLEENKKFLVQPIQTIKAAEIAFQQQATVPDILQNNGNVFMQKSQLGGGSPVIRGFETNKVLMVVDGVRMNNAIYRGGHVQNALTLDGAILDRVEIAYGPSSVMYGSDALGGVMNFITKKPVFSITDKVLVKAGAYTRYQSAANAIQGNLNFTIANKNVSSLTSFTYSKFSDLCQGARTDKYDPFFWNRTFNAQRIDGKDSMVMQKDFNKQTGSGYTQYDFLQKLVFKQSDVVHHLVNFQYSTSSDLPRYDRLTIVEPNGKPKFAEWYYGPQNRLMLSYQLQLTGKTKMFSSSNVTTAYQHITESRISRRFQKDNRITNVEDVFVYSINADFKKKLGKFGKIELNYGSEIQSNDVQSTANSLNIVTDIKSKAPTRYSDGGSKYNSYALYLASILKITPKVIVNAGVRASAITLKAFQVDTTLFAIRLPEKIAQTNKNVSGNIGVVYLPVQNVKLYSLIATGFRAPNLDDISKIFEKIDGALIIPNINLKPETTVNGEIGLAAQIAKKINISTSAYYTRYSNAILLGNTTFNNSATFINGSDTVPVQTNQNALKAYIGGIEATVSVKPLTGFDITSSITYTRGRIVSGKDWGTPLDHIPPLFGRTNISYTFKKLKVEIYTSYSHWKRISDYRLNAEDNEENASASGMPSWGIVSARAGYQVNKMLGIQAGIENLGDNRYRTFASNISSPGRNFMLTLRGTL